MFRLILFCQLLAISAAIGCTPNICNNLQKMEPLNCPGSVIKNGGYCGCTDACAKMEGQVCQAHSSVLLGSFSAGTCDDGLVCQPLEMNLMGKGTCVKAQPDKRAETMTSNPTATTTHTPRTLCERTRSVMLIWNVRYKGMWIPKCDQYGQFVPMQCDNIGQCFCVDPDTGKVDELTKTRGPVFCF